jgi:DNA-directed RNA polymerase specialized sigma24 family protein
VEPLEDLVRQAQHGDREAFTEIVTRFQNMAYGYAYALLGDFAQAEDAAQEAFIEVYLSIHNLHEPAAFPSWFKRGSTNTATGRLAEDLLAWNR